jgi:two-component system, chemotaxis family, sensor kinase CheA
VRGQLVPYIRLRDEFSLTGEPPDNEKVVIVQYEDERVGLVVDRVLGGHQTVIQSLGRVYREIEVVSGATITGDGRVAFILNIDGIVRRTRLSQGAGYAAGARAVEGVCA